MCVQSFQFYVNSYPDGDAKMFGFLTYKIIFFLQLDHIYKAPYFYGLIGLLVAQLIACTHTRQWPIFKARRYPPKTLSEMDVRSLLFLGS